MFLSIPLRRLVALLALLAGWLPALAQTQPGNALNFVTYAYVTAGADLPDYNGTFTVEAWVRTTSVPSGRVVAVSCRDNFTLGIDDRFPGRLLFSADGGYLLSQSRIDDGRWHHVAGTKNGTLVTVYVDGVAEATGNTAGSLYFTGQGLILGNLISNGIYGWPGSLDEVRIWSVTRSAADIKASFNKAPTTPQAGLDVYYDFNRGTAGGSNAGVTSLPNLGGLSGYTGTLNNFALSGNASNWVESYALVQPTNLTASSAASTSLTATWTAPPVGTVSNYVLDCATTADFSAGVTTTTPAGSATSATLTGRSPNTRYYLRLRADKASVTGQGGYSHDQASLRTASGLNAPGNALAFDGSNDYVSVLHSAAFNLTGAITLEAWVNTTSTGEQYITTKAEDSWYLALNGAGAAAGRASFFLNGPSGPGGWLYGRNNLADGHWHYLVGTYDGSVLRLYVDGTLDNSRAATGAVLTGTSAVALGARGTAAYWNGLLDEVRIWSVARSAAQIKAAYTSWPAAPQAGLVATYDFDAGTAAGANASQTTLVDRSGNSQDGTLANFALTGSTSNWVESYALVVPALGAASAVSASGFTANWTAPAVGTVSNYVLDYSTSPTFASVAGTVSPAAGATSQALSGLQFNTTYYYRLRADKASVTGQGVYVGGSVRTANGLTPPGNALAFDGADDFVAVGAPAALSNLGQGPLTMESWVYCTNLPGVNSIIRKGGDYNLVLLSNGILYAEVWTAGTGSSARVTSTAVNPIEAGRWTHVAATWDNSTLRLYVNGVMVPFVQSFPTYSTSEPLQIGRSAVFNQPFSGRLDEVRLYNAALTAAQLQADMASASAAVPASLLLYYNFDQGTAGGNNAGVTTLTDQSGTLADGTLTNFDLSSGNTTSNWVGSAALVVPRLAAASGGSSTGFTANWLAPLTGTADGGYLLDVATSRSFAATALVAGSPFSTTGTSQAVSGLDPTQTYYYRVRASLSAAPGQGAASAVGTYGPTAPMSPPGNALAFDGSNDFVAGRLETLPQGNAARTLEAWVLTTQTSNGVVFNYGTATSNLRSSLMLVGGKLYYAGEGNDLAGSKPVNDGRWHHLAATYDGTTLKLYVDGVLDVSATPPGVVFNTAGSTFRVGSRILTDFTSVQEQFAGRLDEVRVYSVALTAAQVQAELTSTSPAVPGSLLLYYNFDQATAGGSNTGYTTLADRSGSQADGTLLNFDLTSASTTSNWVESYALLLPTGLAATPTSSTSLSASWTAPTINGAAPAAGKVEGYVLDVSTSATFAAGVTSFPVSGAGSTSTTATGLANGTDYYVRVRAEKASVSGQGAVTPALKVHLIGTDALLSNLTASGGVLSPAFATGTLTYTLYVPAGASTFTLTPTASNAYTGIAVNGTAVASGTASGPLSVSSPATVVLTSEDGNATRTYTVQPVAAPTYFRSVATGNWGDATTWEASQDGSTNWFAAPVAPTGSYVGTATVRNGHVVTVAAATSTKTTTIESGGILNTLASQTLTIPSGATMTVNAGGVLSIGRLSGADGVTGTSLNLGTLSVTGANALTVGGTLVLNAGSTTPASQGFSASTTTVGSGGRVVQYASATNLSMPALTWQAGSTLELAGGNTNQTYANISQTLQNLDVNLTTLPASTSTGAAPYLFSATTAVTVAGTLTVRNTGSAALRLFNSPTSGSLTLGSVDGSGVRTGGYVQQAGTSVVGSFGGINGTTSTPITVQGSFQLNGGTFAAALASSTGITALRATPLTVNGDLTVASGATLNLLSAALGPTVNYAGGTVALNGNFSNAGTVSTGNTASTTQKLLFGRAGTLGAQMFSNTGTIAGLVNVATTGTAILDMGSSALTGSGTFTTVAGSTLRLGSPAGISASGTATGNVQSTGTRTYNGNIEYYGPAAQVTGTGLPAALSSTTTLIFNNAAGVTLSQATSLAGTLRLVQGPVTTTATNLLTLGLGGSIPGTLDATATNTGYVVGPLRRWVPATTGTTAFPLGTGAVVRPASINFTTAPTATGTLTGEFVAADPGTNGLPLTEGGKNINATASQGFWRVSAADGLAGGTYTPTFTYTGLARTAAFNPADVVLLKRPDSSQPWSLQGTPVTTTGPATAPVLSRADLTAFSEFTAGGDAAGPLPVQLVAFTATAQSPSAVRLAWTTASELHSLRFDVERSPDGVAFEKIGTVAAAGTKATTTAYAYLDDAAPAGTGYYRLRQVDADGTAHYSAVRAVQLTNSPVHHLTIYPNPARTAATLLGAEAGAPVQVLDALGRLVLTATADATGTAPLALPAGLPAGVYVVRSGRQVLRLTVE